MSSSVSQRTRGALEKAKHIQKPEDHPNLRWTGVDKLRKKMYNIKLMKLSLREIHTLRIVDWRVIRNLGCDEILEDMLLVRIVFRGEILTSNMWKRAVEIREPIYMEWCLEFLSTLTVKTEITDEGVLTDDLMSFRLGGEERSVTLYQFGRLLGLYSEEEVCNDNFKHLIMSGERKMIDFDAKTYLEEISGEDVRVYGRKRVSKIKNPMLQVLHKILVQSVLHRSYYEEFVLDEDLWGLHALDRKHPLKHLNVAWIIAQHLGSRAAAMGDTRICCGHIITRLAKNMGLFNNDEMSLFGNHVRPGNVDMRSFWNIRDAQTGKLKDLPEMLEVEPINKW